MELKKDFLEKHALLFLEPNLTYYSKLMELAIALDKNFKKICYVNLNKTYEKLKEDLIKNKIDIDKFSIIDVIISSPKDFDGINLAFSDFVHKGCKVFLFDSLSAMLAGASEEDLIKFIHTLIVKAKMTNTHVIFLAPREKIKSELMGDLGMLFDKVIPGERKKAAGKAQTKSARINMLKNEFMDIASHELKTPLVPIIGYLELLLDDKHLTASEKEKIRICLYSAKKEAKLVDDITDMSMLDSGTLEFDFEAIDMAKLIRQITDIHKLDSGEMKFEFEAIDLGNLLRNTIKGLLQSNRRKRLTFETEIPPELPLVRGDSLRLIQVMKNLIENTLKFTKKGKITVKAQKHGNNIEVSVADTGIGISRKNMKKLFTKFFQADITVTRQYGGIGLGLAICKGIIGCHKGRIWAKSKLGKGSTFFFAIPILKTWLTRT